MNTKRLKRTFSKSDSAPRCLGATTQSSLSRRKDMGKMLSGILLVIIATVASFVPWESTPAMAAGEKMAVGERIYRENCAACHGVNGDGYGPEADRLKTRPRDFTSGRYKFQSTPAGSLPLDEDIFRTVSRGVRTTSMLAQLHLSEAERWAVTEYLKTFSPRFKSDRPGKAIAIPAPPNFNS